MKRRTLRRPYDKPSVTRVRLTVEHSVLQGCHSNLPNPTGASGPIACYITLFCQKTPAE
jgi:hypothetical protein